MRLSVKFALALFLLVGGGVLGFALLTRPPPASSTPPVSSSPSEALPSAVFDLSFRRCAHCHEIGNGAGHKIGPHLNEVFGRPAGRAAGYPFSKFMRESGIVWDAAVLARFLRSPSAVVPGSRMVFEGIPDEAEVARVLEFLARARVGEKGGSVTQVGRTPG